MPGPRIEDLEHVSPGLHLHAERLGADLRHAVQELIDELGLAVGQAHEVLHVAGESLLTGVGCQGPRRAGKADDGGLLAELPLQPTDRLAGRLHDLLDVAVESLEVGAFLHRISYDRSRIELELDAQAGEGNQDVGEDDDAVHAEAPMRMQRDLGRSIRICAQLEEARLLTELAVLRQVTPRLPHQPDRGSVDGLAPAGAEEALPRSHLAFRVGRSHGPPMIGGGEQAR